LGKAQLKWDALWHLLAWLLDPRQGHGLGDKVLEAFCLHTFDRRFPSECLIHPEYQLSAVKDGRGKWVDLALAIPSLDKAATHVAIMDDVDRRSPGSKRKLDNLVMYRSLARDKFPSGIIRVI